MSLEYDINETDVDDDEIPDDQATIAIIVEIGLIAVGIALWAAFG